MAQRFALARNLIKCVILGGSRALDFFVKLQKCIFLWKKVKTTWQPLIAHHFYPYGRKMWNFLETIPCLRIATRGIFWKRAYSQKITAKHTLPSSFKSVSYQTPLRCHRSPLTQPCPSVSTYVLYKIMSSYA